MALEAKVEIIDPRMAVDYLSRNKLNRPLRMKWVLALSRQMKTNGEWHLSGEPIIFGQSGNLLDGQHRLKALIHSETSHKFLVVRNAKDETFTTIDTGQKRSPKDALYIAGFPYPELYARLGLNCLRWNRGIFFGSSNPAIAPSNDEIVSYVTRHRKETAETINHYMQFKNRLRKLIGGQIILFTYHKFKEIDEQDAFIFTEKLIDGMFSADREQPIRVLRERLLVNVADEAKLQTRSTYFMVFAAWNAFRSGKKLDNLSIPQSFLNKKGGKVTLL
jgi:hypothetical protein